MVTVKNILDIINNIAPFDFSEDWDNSGLQVGNLNFQVEKVMVSLEATQEVIRAANAWGANVIVTHHPLIMSPIKCIDFSAMPGLAIENAVLNNMSIISAHTNLDKASMGLNDHFAKLLEIINTRPLVQDFGDDEYQNSMMGIGRIGRFKKGILLHDLVKKIKNKLNINKMRISGKPEAVLKTVAICTGSGGSLIKNFLDSDADVYITGDTKYHEARLVEEFHRSLIDVGHFASEHIVVNLLVQRLMEESAMAGFSVKIKGFKNEKDPFTII
jgi:dinuclear metal center YbgI/SA1388 family protein